MQYYCFFGCGTVDLSVWQIVPDCAARAAARTIRSDTFRLAAVPLCRNP